MSKRKWGMDLEKVNLHMRVDARGAINLPGRYVCIGGEVVGVDPEREAANVQGRWNNDGILKDDWWWVHAKDLRPHIPRKQPKRDAAGKFAKKEPESLKVGDLVDYVGSSPRVTPFSGLKIIRSDKGSYFVRFALYRGKEVAAVGGGSWFTPDALRRSSLVEGTPEWAEAVGRQGLRVAGDEFINDNWLTFENGMWRTKFYPNVTGPLKCVGVKTWRIVGRHVKDEEKQEPAAETNPHPVGSWQWAKWEGEKRPGTRIDCSVIPLIGGPLSFNGEEWKYIDGENSGGPEAIGCDDWYIVEDKPKVDSEAIKVLEQAVQSLQIAIAKLKETK